MVAKFLGEHDIVVEKSGPYLLLFIFSLGTTKAKSVRLISVLNKFKQMYDENTLVGKMLPTLYAEDHKFYDGKSKKLVSNFMSILKMLIYLTLLYHAFNVLPEQQLN